MLTCIACSKQQQQRQQHLNDGSLQQQDNEDAAVTPRTKQAIKALTSQVVSLAQRSKLENVVFFFTWEYGRFPAAKAKPPPWNWMRVRLGPQESWILFLVERLLIWLRKPSPFYLFYLFSIGVVKEEDAVQSNLRNCSFWLELFFLSSNPCRDLILLWILFVEVLFRNLILLIRSRIWLWRLRGRAGTASHVRDQITTTSKSMRTLTLHPIRLDSTAPTRELAVPPQGCGARKWRLGWKFFPVVRLHQHQWVGVLNPSFLWRKMNPKSGLLRWSLVCWSPSFLCLKEGMISSGSASGTSLASFC